MAEITAYALPVYEAVVCGLTLAKLRKDESDEREREKLRSTIECEEKMRIAYDAFAKGDFSAIGRTDAVQMATALTVLVSTIHQLVPSLRDSLEVTSKAYRAAQADVLKHIEELGARLEEIAEAWFMAADETTAKEIRAALSSTVKKDQVAPWREVLASVKD